MVVFSVMNYQNYGHTATNQSHGKVLKRIKLVEYDFLIDKGKEIKKKKIVRVNTYLKILFDF
jgi:hypothetical protein